MTFLWWGERSPQWRVVVLSVLCAGLLNACTGGVNETPEPTESIPSQQVDPNLTFENVTLEQVGDDGKVLWVVQAARVTYSNDRKVAELEQPSGKLYREGEFVYEVTADRGTLQQEGQQIFLNENVVVTDQRQGTVVRGQAMHWQPEAERLDVTGNVSATHDNADIQAEQVVFLSEPQHLQAIGGVVANLKEPALQIATEELLWQMPEEMMVGDRPVQVAQYEVDENATPAAENEPETAETAENTETPPTPPPTRILRDRATAERIRVDLATQIATLEQNARIAVEEPPLDVVSNVIDWDLSGELVTSNVPVRVTHRENDVVLSGNRGWMNLVEEVFYLSNGIEVLGQNNEAQMTASELTWFVPDERFEAQGNVVYRQVDPPMELRGQQAEGKLENQTFVMSGGEVVTEILTDAF